MSRHFPFFLARFLLNNRQFSFFAMLSGLTVMSLINYRQSGNGDNDEN